MSEFAKRTVELEIRAGMKAGWFEVKIGEKKFIMKQVDRFLSESANSVEEIFGGKKVK